MTNEKHVHFPTQTKQHFVRLLAFVLAWRLHWWGGERQKGHYNISSLYKLNQQSIYRYFSNLLRIFVFFEFAKKFEGN